MEPSLNPKPLGPYLAGETTAYMKSSHFGRYGYRPTYLDEMQPPHLDPVLGRDKIVVRSRGWVNRMHEEGNAN